MKDPLARDPRAVIAAADVGDHRLAGKWEPYLSLDPAMTRLRATRSLDSLSRTLETSRLLFALGSATLDAPAMAQLSSAAAVIRRLDEIAASIGDSVHIGVTGRTDTTGAADRNATLAERRVAAVSDFLASMGIDRSRLVPDPVATAKPLQSDNEDERARINRSVSFNVALSAPSSRAGGQR